VEEQEGGGMKAEVRHLEEDNALLFQDNRQLALDNETLLLSNQQLLAVPCEQESKSVALMLPCEQERGQQECDVSKSVALMLPLLLSLSILS